MAAMRLSCCIERDHGKIGCGGWRRVAKKTESLFGALNPRTLDFRNCHAQQTGGALITVIAGAQLAGSLNDEHHRATCSVVGASGVEFLTIILLVKFHGILDSFTL
jgi:hypothetical protein